eukprot:GEMP01049943.1.p1 GENE.GEMP01049943.1~~GEMP01049943.1.p1  ORF type:complete len:416 (+),score=67.33 GEMP01049943.1:156-1403(+)
MGQAFPFRKSSSVVPDIHLPREPRGMVWASKIKGGPNVRLQAAARKVVAMIAMHPRADAWLPKHLRPPTLGELDNILVPLPNGLANLHHFDQICTLGVGTFGRVRMVQIKNNATPFALKCISKWKMTSEWGQVTVAARSLIREIEILKRVKGPFIANFFRCFHDDEFAYILLEFINGGETTRFVEEAEFITLDAIRFVTAELVLTLGDLHSRGVVYRDFKPSNILLDTGGHIKVCDFGLAKIIDGTKTTTPCGTLCYQAPEVILQQAYSYPVDWWALGCVIYELRTKELCFGGDSPFDVQQRILSLNIRWPSKPKVPGKLKKFLYTLLIMAPEKRSQCKQALKHVLLKNFPFAGIKARTVCPPYKMDVSSPTERARSTKQDQVESFPPLAAKEKQAWNQELANIMGFHVEEPANT